MTNLSHAHLCRNAVIGYSPSLVTHDHLTLCVCVCVCVCRTISPVLNGVIWASSLSEENRRIGFPVDYHLIFVLFGAIYLSCVFIVALLPKSISKQKKAPPEGTEAEPSVHDEGERTEADSHSTVDNPRPMPNAAEEDTETYL